MPHASRAIATGMRFAAVALSGVLLPWLCTAAELPSSPDGYLDQAHRVRRSVDRPWEPGAGRLGNLRAVQIAAQDCVVRVVSGTENRVFPGASGVTVVEQSRILDVDPNERPTPHDVVLAADGMDPCPGEGRCGVSTARVSGAPRVGGASLCFTLQVATPHDLMLRGEGVDLVLDQVRQPAMRISVGNAARSRLWMEDIDIGLVSIRVNAPVEVGGSGRVDYLNADSSSHASRVYLHLFRASHTGVSTTTTGTRWSVRTGPDTWAGYYQPARAPGDLARLYDIEIDGPLDRLEVPASRVSPRPISAATREAVRALREAVLTRAGPAPMLPASAAVLPTAVAAARALPRSVEQRVADVVASHLPASARITDVTLWKQGGRVEGTAPDLDTARGVAARLEDSGEFVFAQGNGAGAREGTYHFSVILHFHCQAPGEPSACPAGAVTASGRYSEARVRAEVEQAMGPDFRIADLRIDGRTVRLQGISAPGTDPRAGLDALRRQSGMLRVSSTTIGPSPQGGSSVGATLNLQCVAPPRADGICATPDGG